MKEQVLNAMREAGKPVSAGEVAKSLNADRKEVDKAFADLKKEGAIVSPVRCKWAPANWFTLATGSYAANNFVLSTLRELKKMKTEKQNVSHNRGTFFCMDYWLLFGC